VFVVDVDGQTLFDRRATGRFPEEGELVALIEAKRGAKKS